MYELRQVCGQVSGEGDFLRTASEPVKIKTPWAVGKVLTACGVFLLIKMEKMVKSGDAGQKSTKQVRGKNGGFSTENRYFDLHNIFPQLKVCNK